MPVPLEIPPRLLISDLCQLLSTYLEAPQVREVYHAYLFSAQAHEGQKRKTGEAYIFHPLAAAYILGQMQMDTQTLCAALLHDVIEDTPISKEQLKSEFGEQVAELVDGVSKLSSMHFKTREQAQASNFRKMLLAMNRDIRVIIVKLADRLHNMRTLWAMKPQSQRRIARETLEIYAPLANRLGMNSVRIELEELSFETLYPWRYQVLSNHLQKLYQKHDELFNTVQATIIKRLAHTQIKAQILRGKIHYYGLYQKMGEKKGAHSPDKRKSFSQITNTCTSLIIVDSIDDCYRILGIVHGIYKPICERFQDYIAIPKINGYQSLHTVLFSPHGILIHIQIRTTAMHQVAEKGITAPGLLSFTDDLTHLTSTTHHTAHQRAREWLRGLLEIQKSASDSQEFLEHVKTDLFPDEVYVFTPQGKILQLPKGATAIDFAYAIHSDIGDQCIAAKVDNQYVPLSTTLMSGQTVEVFTATWARPNPSWLNFAVSARARSHIRHFLKNLQYDKAILLGRRMLEKELAVYSLSIDKLCEEQCQQLLESFKINSLEELLADIGLGNRIALIVARQLVPEADSILKPLITGESKPLMIKGTEDILVHFARCCRPIPGDDIVGFISAGRGIIIHTATCRHVAEYRHQPEKLQAVEWEPEITGEFVVDISIEVHNQLGVLATIAAGITNMESNIEQVSNENHEGQSIIKFCILVRHRVHLASIMRHLRRLEDVIRIHRSKN